MATIDTAFKLAGPLFENKAADNLQKAVNRGLLDLATIEGSNKVKEQLYPGHGRVIGNLRNHVGANLVRDNLAQIDAGQFRYGANLIYSNWVEGIDKRNKTSVFKGYGMFANAHAHINNNPELFDRYIGDAIAEALGG